jgi:hypothetical protein
MHSKVLIPRTFCFRQSTENYSAGEQPALFFLAFQFFVAFLLMTLPGFISLFQAGQPALSWRLHVVFGVKADFWLLATKRRASCRELLGR